MKNVPLPSIKLRPDILPNILRIVSGHEGDRKKMDVEIHRLFRETSGRSRPPSFKNATRAVTYPSLRQLGLLFGEGQNVHLTASGTLLLRASEEGHAKYQRVLARHIVRWDEEGPRLLGEGGPLAGRLTVSKLARALSTDLPPGVVEDRLSRILPFYEAAGLVRKDGEHLFVNSGQVQAAMAPNPLPKPNRDEFVRALLAEYDRLARIRSSPAVPIPLIERAVTERFAGRLWVDDFRSILATLPPETPEYVLHFSQPMSREPMGIRIGGRYYYYVQIHRRR